MSEPSESRRLAGLSSSEALAARWDTVAYRAQGSPFENLSMACLAKNAGTRPWSRPGGKVKGDNLARYVYLSFEELQEFEKLDEKTIKLLVEICEMTFTFEEECDDMGSFEEIDAQAKAQRMRFVEEYGLYQDYPVALANLDADLRELCEAEEVRTFIDLMGFIDRLADKAWIGGSYKSLQNVFAHGDERGLQRYFPYRMGHRGFHFPEALSFCLNRIRRRDLQAVFDYRERRRKRSRLGNRRPDLPEVVETQLLPEVLECMHYFGKRQPRLLVRLHDSAFLARELMFLNDPQTEGVLHWLIHLALGIFKPSLMEDVDEELKELKVKMSEDRRRELSEMFDAEET